MTTETANAEPCSCGCGAELTTTEYGVVCTCQCAEDQKAHTIAQQLYSLRAQREVIDRQIGVLTTAQAEQPAA